MGINFSAVIPLELGSGNASRQCLLLPIKVSQLLTGTSQMRSPNWI